MSAGNLISEGSAAAGIVFGPAEIPAAPAPAKAKARPDRLVQLVDLSGVTWLRHLCRSCRKTPLWAVLGEPTPMCGECQERLLRAEPLGSRRFDRLSQDSLRHELQYHGDMHSDER